MVKKEISKTKQFIFDFFESSKIKEDNGVLTVSGVPADFEKFVGKKAPYKLVFDFKKHNKIPNSELITEGSYFLATIRDYLLDKGQTSLLNLEIPTKKLDINDYIKFGNCELMSIKKGKENRFLSRFTFLSSCQYLNDKKQFMRDILVKDGKVLDLELGKLKEGRKADIGDVDLGGEYDIAMIRLANILKEETKEIKLSLRKKLRRELERIKGYYSHQIREKDEETERCNEKIKNFKSKLRHTFYERDADILRMNIREYTERLEKLRKRGYAKRLKAEEEFHITDETNKHALLIDNHLMNASIIYYPLDVFTLVCQRNGVKKSIQMTYDLLFEKFDSLSCESCKKAVKKIDLCKKDHLVCKKCLKRCSCCRKKSKC
ncbi:hypothetical protein ACFLZZ_00490 [Nanoarchaeota archaeon]